MLDIKLLRADLEGVAAQLKKRGFVLDVRSLCTLENKRKGLQVQTEALQAKRNANAKAVGKAKSKGEAISALLTEGVVLSEALTVLEESFNCVQEELDEILWSIPNLLHESVPYGVYEHDNVEVRKWGEIKEFDFEPKDHVSLGEQLGYMDFETAAKISGARFVVLYGPLARLQRALIQFMLDLHTRTHGYQEIYVPYLVNCNSMYGTGQFPKFRDDQFTVQGDPGFSLIPTTEVPLANLVRESILEIDELPKKFVGYSSNFRRESGNYGKDTRGMLRQHQFEKVELVRIEKPENSYEALEELTRHAEEVLRQLKLPYRVMLLCSGDTGFSSAKTYDLQVWMPGQNQYREISSCSNCEAFQARRMQARFKDQKTSKTEFVHTLNGSGLAVGRTLIAIMENYQDQDGSIHIPKILWQYMGGLEIIKVI
jgi:seryl-tRNA synthetase